MGIEILIIFVIGAFVYATLGIHLLNKHRTKKLNKVALKYGYEFYETDPGYSNTISSANYKLLNIGHSGKICNIFAKQIELIAGQNFLPGIKMIFDYSYYSTSGTKPIIYTQTVLSFKSKVLTLPSFSLHKGCFLESLLSKFDGIKDINFKNYPGFSNKYSLWGENEEEIREFFDNSLLVFFENFPEAINVDTGNDSVIIFFEKRRLEENDIMILSDILDRIVTIFKIRMEN